MNCADIVEVVPYAISSDSGKASLFIPDNDGFVGRYSLQPGRGTRTVEVNRMTLEQLIRESGLVEVGLIKIDCQGSEYEILFGTCPSIFSKIQQIIVECEVFPDHHSWTQGNLKAYLRDVGFNVTVEGNMLYAWQPRSV